MNDPVEDERFAEANPHGDRIEFFEVGVGPERVVAVDPGQGVHVVDSHRSVVGEEVAREEDQLNDLDGLQSNHFMEESREDKSEEGQCHHCVAEVKSNLLNRTGLNRNERLVVPDHLERDILLLFFFDLQISLKYKNINERIQ